MTTVATINYEHAGFPVRLNLYAYIYQGQIKWLWWCGYVAVPQNHPLHGKDYIGEWDEVKDEHIPSPVTGLRVHGGITYADDMEGMGWTFGFDCHHGSDGDTPDDEERWKTQSYAAHEAERLAEQLAELMPK